MKTETNLPCECETWCRVDSLESRHHPNCKHYEAPPPDPRHAIFGKLVWEWIEKKGGEFCWREESEDILPLAQRAGLVRRVNYDPDKHGFDIEADPGSEIWFWGEEEPAHPRESLTEERTNP